MPRPTVRHLSEMLPMEEAVVIIRKIIHGVLKFIRGITKTDFDTQNRYVADFAVRDYLVDFSLRNKYSIDFAERSYTVDFTDE